MEHACMRLTVQKKRMNISRRIILYVSFLVIQFVGAQRKKHFVEWKFSFEARESVWIVVSTQKKMIDCIYQFVIGKYMNVTIEVESGKCDVAISAVKKDQWP